jgi:hypothetical protein
MTKNELQVALAAATDTTNGWLFSKSTSAAYAKGTVTAGSAESLADSSQVTDPQAYCNS